MGITLLLHVSAGMAGLVTGYIALFARKGSTVHRRAGTVFVYAMLAMCAAGFIVTAARSVAPAINIPAALLTACLVVTALTTVRPPTTMSRRIDTAAMLVAAGVGVTSLVFGAQAIAGGGTRHGMPAFPFFMFGIVGVLAAAGDWRALQAGPPAGAPRIARHLWRMSFALFIAALSFFIGQMRVIPQPLRRAPLLALPVLAVLVTMIYWLWRVRVRRSLRGVFIAAPPAPARVRATAGN